MQLDESKMRRGVMCDVPPLTGRIVRFRFELKSFRVRPGRDDPHASQRALVRWLYGRPRTARGDAPTFLTAFHDSAGCAQEKVVKPRLAPGPSMELS